MAGVHVQAPLGLKTLAHVFEHVLNTRCFGRARLCIGGEPVSDGLEKLRPEAPMTLDVMHGRYAAWFRARLVRRYGVQDAEDILQEAWLRLAPHQGIAGIRHPKALLLKIASNLAADKFGRRRRRDEAAGDTVAAQGWNIELPSQADEMFAKQVVMGLPQPLRDVFVLSRIKGLSNRQIAEQLGISPKTVEWRMTKALAHCTAQFRR